MVTALVFLHNADWRAAEQFAPVAAVYCLASWLILKKFFRQTSSIHLGDLFLATDVLVLLYAIELTGGPRSWLFFLLAGRRLDQIALGYRRVIWFNHLTAGSYVLLIDGFAAHAGGLDWRMEAVKLGMLYAFNWYCTSLARSVETLRRRTKRADAVRRAAAEVSGTIAHAIRTRVNRITVGLDLLRQTGLTERQRDYTETMTQCSRDSMGLVRALGAPSAESGGVERGSIFAAGFCSRKSTPSCALLRNRKASVFESRRRRVYRRKPLAMPARSGTSSSVLRITR